MLYTSDNVLISGTHTHSAPGGYTGYHIYDLTGGGFNQQTYECIVSGIVASIEKAHNNLAPGNIYLNKGDIPDCGRNRSLEAYPTIIKMNADKYANLYSGHAYRGWPYGSDAGATDKEMLLLKFTKSDPSGASGPSVSFPGMASSY